MNLVCRLCSGSIFFDYECYVHMILIAYGSYLGIPAKLWLRRGVIRVALLAVGCGFSRPDHASYVHVCKYDFSVQMHIVTCTRIRV